MRQAGAAGESQFADTGVRTTAVQVTTNICSCISPRPKDVQQITFSVVLNFKSIFWWQNFTTSLLCTWFRQGMNHRDGGGLHHVATDELQRFPGSLVNAPQLLLLLVRDPQPVLKHSEAERTTWVETGKVMLWTAYVLSDLFRINTIS